MLENEETIKRIEKILNESLELKKEDKEYTVNLIITLSNSNDRNKKYFNDYIEINNIYNEKNKYYIEELFGKSEKEIKQFLKKVIMEKKLVFDWEDFSLKYNKIFADYNEEEDEGNNYKSISNGIYDIIDEFDVDCNILITDIYIDDNILVLIDNNGDSIYIKNNNKQQKLIQFLTDSIMKLCIEIEIIKNDLNSIFD